MEESSSSDELVVAVSSTVVVFLVISILTLIAGFVCGYYIRDRKCKESSKKTGKPAAVPFYEDIDMLPSAVQYQERNLELKENVAYGPSKSISVEQQ